jgi:hypothetical protein
VYVTADSIDVVDNLGVDICTTSKNKLPQMDYFRPQLYYIVPTILTDTFFSDIQFPKHVLADVKKPEEFMESLKEIDIM